MMQHTQDGDVSPLISDGAAHRVTRDDAIAHRMEGDWKETPGCVGKGLAGTAAESVNKTRGVCFVCSVNGDESRESRP